MRKTFARHRFDAAHGIVSDATRWSPLVSCLLFAFIAFSVLAGVVGVVVSAFFFQLSRGYVAMILVGAIVVSAIPWIVHMVRTANKVRRILEQIRCPHCHEATWLSIDETNVYVLICDACRVFWVTGVGAPSSDSHHDHHHHHHH